MAIRQEKTGQRCLKMSWLGVAGIELRVNKQILVIDPFVTRPPIKRMWWGRIRSDFVLAAATVPHGDLVLVTHAHWDHVMDVPAIIEQTRATAYGSQNTYRLLTILGVPEDHLHEIKVGDKLALGDVSGRYLAGRTWACTGTTFRNWLACSKSTSPTQDARLSNGYVLQLLDRG